jgi:hypothetical protein
MLATEMRITRNGEANIPFYGFGKFFLGLKEILQESEKFFTTIAIEKLDKSLRLVLKATFILTLHVYYLKPNAKSNTKFNII